MLKVLILVGEETDPRLVEALREAINESRPGSQCVIQSISHLSSLTAFQDFIVCPLILNVPDTLQFPGQTIYRACRDVEGMRGRVKKLGIRPGYGKFWLPIVSSVKGPLYAEVIGVRDKPSQKDAFSATPYYQPVHLSDVWRQKLYALGFRLLDSLRAPPATYLIQFGFEGQEICFDRLWPFPAEPAIASLTIQIPNLMICHCYCLTEKPIYDLQISLPLAELV